MRFQTKNGVLIAQANGETLRIEPWGKDSLRVRATMLPGFSGKDWALTEVPEKTEAKAEQFAVDHLEIDGSMGKRTSASITNGKIRAVVNFAGVITFYRDGRQFLREYYRSYDGTLSRESRCLKTVNREWKGIIGGSEFSLNLKFDSNDGEKIFGMGQYQQAYMDLKGCTLGAGPEKFPDKCSFCCIQSRLWYVVEQSGCRTGHIWKELYRMDCTFHQGYGLLAYSSRCTERDPGKLYSSDRPRTEIPRGPYGPVAVQAALPYAGGSA